MSTITRAMNIYRNNKKEFWYCLMRKFCGNWMPDGIYLRILYRIYMGKCLHLRNPKTFSEKLQWLKIHNRKPEYTMMVDKFAVKDYVASIIGAEHIIPTLGVWDRPEDIDFDALPNQFVLKPTQGGGGHEVVICLDKSTLNCNAVIEKLKIGLKQNSYRSLREWPYKNVPRRIIAEKFINSSPEVKDLIGYKWYCFDGEPKICQVVQNRTAQESIDFFDTEWRHKQFVGLNSKAIHAEVLPSKPSNIATQLRIAHELSKEIQFSRIDLYETGDNIYFVEIAFYPASGMEKIKPDEYNEILEAMLRLPGEKRGGHIVNVSSDGELLFSKPDLHDYKFFCFNGSVKFFKIDYDRYINHRANYYDKNLKLQEFGEEAFLPDPNAEVKIPENINEMISLAEKLSLGHPFLRVDLYNIGGKIYFGELTFFPASGLEKFTPEVYDEIIGNYIDLNIVK